MPGQYAGQRQAGDHVGPAQPGCCRFVRRVVEAEPGEDERKQRQVEHAHELSERARLVKLADKICNVYDIAAAPPAKWTIERKREYLEWAKAVIDRLRGTHPRLEAIFDHVYATGVRTLAK